RAVFAAGDLGGGVVDGAVAVVADFGVGTTPAEHRENDQQDHGQGDAAEGEGRAARHGARGVTRTLLAHPAYSASSRPDLDRWVRRGRARRAAGVSGAGTGGAG